ncbi:hypothetical protein E8E13_002660 [Curvularia kusanoi]|uniref:Uncharacterized protein n=1 Tax=Curvularia kusanoi TaxID=90978 RepID=A0A9P4T6G6_CURKU|nr:hypothetical protein E8E13_002660 [Curvularia kusanoi]
MDEVENVLSSKHEHHYDTFVEVFESLPAYKEPNPKAKKPSRQYVTPKFKHQQHKLSELFLNPNNHFVDRAINHFQAEFDKKIRETVDQHFNAIEEDFDKFESRIRAEGPINYRLKPEGKAIRADVRTQLLGLQARIDQLKTLLPAPVSDQGDPMHDIGSGEGNDDDLAAVSDMMSKRKKAAPFEGSRPKKIKQESF